MAKKKKSEGLLRAERGLAEMDKAERDKLNLVRRSFGTAPSIEFLHPDDSLAPDPRKSRKDREREIFLNLSVNASCSHRRHDGRLNISWMQHSAGIIGGVCGQCFSQFDTRNPAHKKLLDEDWRAVKNMGRVLVNNASPIIPPETFWTKVRRWFDLINAWFRGKRNDR